MENNYYCHSCNKHLKNSILYKNYIDEHLFCNLCLKSQKVCSRSKCKKIFLLSDNDINGLKKIFINSNQQFFLYNDVKKVVLNKYGTMKNLENILLDKKRNKDIKITKQNNSKLDRENKLREALIINKLEYKNYGDCYSYIHYGKPSLETVIFNELKKNQEKSNRRTILAMELNKLGLTLDESIPLHYEFINNLNDKSLWEVINCVKKENGMFKVSFE